MIQGSSGRSLGSQLVHLRLRQASAIATRCSPASRNRSGNSHGTTSSLPSTRRSRYNCTPHTKLPNRHRYIVTPSEYTSIAPEMRPRTIPSGAPQGKVLPGRARVPMVFASPKSMRRRRSLRQRMRLAGLKSQCARRWRCRKSSPLAACSTSSTRWYSDTGCRYRKRYTDAFYSHSNSNEFSRGVDYRKQVGRLGWLTAPNAYITPRSAATFEPRRWSRSTFLARRSWYSECGWRRVWSSSRTLNLATRGRMTPWPPISFCSPSSLSGLSSTRRLTRKSNFSSCLVASPASSPFGYSSLPTSENRAPTRPPTSPAPRARRAPYTYPLNCSDTRISSLRWAEGSTRCPLNDSTQTSRSAASILAIRCCALGSILRAGSSWGTGSGCPWKCRRRKRWRMRSSRMKVMRKVRLTRLRLNLRSARAASMKEECSSSSSPEAGSKVSFSGLSSALSEAAARTAINCCSRAPRCRNRPFTRQFPRTLSRLSAGENATSKWNWKRLRCAWPSRNCNTC